MDTAQYPLTATVNVGQHDYKQVIVWNEFAKNFGAAHGNDEGDIAADIGRDIANGMPKNLVHSKPLNPNRLSR